MCKENKQEMRERRTATHPKLCAPQVGSGHLCTTKGERHDQSSSSSRIQPDQSSKEAKRSWEARGAWGTGRWERTSGERAEPNAPSSSDEWESRWGVQRGGQTHGDADRTRQDRAGRARPRMKRAARPRTATRHVMASLALATRRVPSPQLRGNAPVRSRHPARERDNDERQI